VTVLSLGGIGEIGEIGKNDGIGEIGTKKRKKRRHEGSGPSCRRVHAVRLLQAVMRAA